MNTRFKPIEEIVPRSKWSWDAPDYWGLMESTGLSIHVQGEHLGHQGDSWAVVSDGDRWGFLTFGWGSCSGCDALQACDSLKDFDDLRTVLYDGIVWKDSKDDLLKYMTGKDWEVEWYGRDGEFSKFLKEALEFLRQ